MKWPAVLFALLLATACRERARPDEDLLRKARSASNAVRETVTAANLPDVSARCERGDAEACMQIGVVNAEGSLAPLIPQDDVRAFEMGTRACSLGSALGCANLGTLYKLGRGTAKDVPKARALFEKACDASSLLGCVLLGNLYRTGEGVPLDVARARKLYEDACSAGSPVGCNNLGSLLEKGDSSAEALQASAAAYRRGCEGGEAVSCYNLGAIYVKGVGVPEDRPRGLALLDLGCEMGHRRACEFAKLVAEKR
jgi:uncharacterized protein